MKKIQPSVYLICCCLLPATTFADKPITYSLENPLQTDKKAQTIIRSADRIRAPNEQFRYQVVLLEHKNGKPQLGSEQTLDVSMRFYKASEVRANGDARALVRFVAPLRDKGKVLFSDLDQMWFYSPDLRRPIPISRQQRLVGQVSNGDVVAADFDYSYTSVLLGEEACGAKTCYKLSLKRRWPHVTYPEITYWVEKNTHYPYRADFLSTEKVVIKRSYYHDFKSVLGVNRPTRVIIEDALKKNNYTIMTYTNVRLESLPETYFQKEYLMRLDR